MMSSSRLTATGLTLLAVICSSCADAVTAPSAAAKVQGLTSSSPSVTVVMSGLESPRDVEIGPEGAVYVAESGTMLVTGPCVAVEGGDNCYSGTGAISRLFHGKQERVATGLPSIYNAGFGDPTGPQRISFQGRGGMYVTIGWGGEPAMRSALGSVGADLAAVIVVQPGGTWRKVADIGAYEQAHNPDGGDLNSNPFGLLAEAGRQFVTDGGGNSLYEVRANGTLSLLATFAPVPVPAGPFNPPFTHAEAVPTQVRRGPDGALYVSTLTGVPFLPGRADIYRVSGGAPTVFAAGFTSILDFEWAPTGDLYVLEYASQPFLGGTGSLLRVSPNGMRTTVVSDLSAPTGLAVGRDGAVYVSQKHNVPGGGEVLRIVQ